jgi:alpha/beta superfamily hydrolase
MTRRIESLFISGQAGKIEAILEEPEDRKALEAALVCHPHPLHGGTMHNKVVYRLARGLRRAGEGVHDDGRGEVEDASICLSEIRSRYPQLPAMVAGFSFGSRVALRVAARDSSLTRVIAVGFPSLQPDGDYVREVRIRKVFVQSTHDEHGPRSSFEPFFNSLPQPKELVWIESADHFFKDALDPFERAIEQIGCSRGAA